jgi:hypothetical protein
MIGGYGLQRGLFEAESERASYEPFFTALAFSALRCACAGLMDFSFGMIAV